MNRWRINEKLKTRFGFVRMLVERILLQGLSQSHFNFFWRVKNQFVAMLVVAEKLHFREITA